MAIHHELIVMSKVFAVALAVGLDVLAVSVGIGVMKLALDASVRLGCAFATSEIAMQVLGYVLGTGAGKMLGERYEHNAERCAGALLILLAAIFAIEHLA